MSQGTRTYTPISKNVGENGEWHLSKGNCTTEKNCGFHIWYAKTINSPRGVKLILPYERPTGPRLNMTVHQVTNIAFHCPFTSIFQGSVA